MMKKVTTFLLPAITLLFVLCIGVLVSKEFNTIQPIALVDKPFDSNRFPADSPITPAGKININTASAEDLTLLSGIGEVLSQRIVAYREENGPYTQTEDLLNVKGIGKITLSKIADYIAVE